MGPLNQFQRIPLNFKLQRGLLAALLAWPTFTLAQSNAVSTQEQVPALYQQALNALQNNQFENAAQLLQQVVQQHPELAGAWLDLSWLALRQENFAQAEEFLLILEQRFAPLPEGVQLAVNQLKLKLSAHLKLEQASASSGRHQTAISMATGYDNNVNAGLRINAITLTLPDRNLELSVASANRPIGAAFVRASLVHQLKLALDGGALALQMQVQGRSYEGLPQYANLEALPQISLEHKDLAGVLTFGMQAIALNRVLAYKAPIVRWQLEKALPALDVSWQPSCKWQQQVQMEQRQYLLSANQNSHWWGIKPMLQCETSAWQTNLYVQRAQENDASGNRPGGNTRQLLWGLQQDWLAPFGLAGHRVQLRLETQHSQDAQGYSYLLENGAPRSLRTSLSQISWNAPLAPQSPWRWSLGLQKSSQQSNLAIFTHRNYSLESSIWRAW